MKAIQPGIKKTAGTTVEAGERWLGSWFASQTYYDARFAAFDTLDNQTIRMIVHPHYRRLYHTIEVIQSVWFRTGSIRQRKLSAFQ